MKKLGKLHLSLFRAVNIELIIVSPQNVSADHSLDGKGMTERGQKSKLAPRLFQLPNNQAFSRGYSPDNRPPGKL